MSATHVSDGSTLHVLFRTSGNVLSRQNRIILIMLVTGSILLLTIIIIGAPFYYYKYGRGDNKASISKNPNYGLSLLIEFTRSLRCASV